MPQHNVQLINHGVDTSLVEELKLETKEFFNLPLEEKQKYAQTSNEVEGYGQVFMVSEDQKRDWADVFLFTTLPKHRRRPNLLPKLPLPYRFLLPSSHINCYTFLQQLFLSDYKSYILVAGPPFFILYPSLSLYNTLDSFSKNIL